MNVSAWVNAHARVRIARIIRWRSKTRELFLYQFAIDLHMPIKSVTCLRIYVHKSVCGKYMNKCTSIQLCMSSRGSSVAKFTITKKHNWKTVWLPVILALKLYSFVTYLVQKFKILSGVLFAFMFVYNVVCHTYKVLKFGWCKKC